MKYLGLAYYSPKKFAAMAPEAIEAPVNQCPVLDEKIRATGKVLVAASLGEPDARTTLRPRAGKAQVSDGPYTESKEMVSGLSSSRRRATTRRCASPRCIRPPRRAKRRPSAVL